MVTMRLPRLPLQLLALLLLMVFWGCGAFAPAPNVQIRPQIVRPIPVLIRKSGETFIGMPYLIYGNYSNDTIMRPGSQTLLQKTGERNTSVSSMKKNPLLWSFMLMLLRYTQTTGLTPVLPIIDSSSLKDKLYSTVSAALLGGLTSKGRVSGQLLVLASFMGWRILTQSETLTNLIWMAGTKFSTSYMTCLSSFPLYTKAVTAAVISFFGDSTAQAIEEMKRAKSEDSRFTLRNYDRRRGLTKFADSIFITGPMLHFVYGWLEHMIPVAGAINGLSASLAALLQVLIDDIVFDSISVAIMFVTTGVGEGRAEQIIPQLRRDYVRVVKTSWATSLLVMPLQFACFRFLPLSCRVLGIKIIDIIWEGTLSYTIHRNRKQERFGKEFASVSESTVQIPKARLLQPVNGAVA